MNLLDMFIVAILCFCMIRGIFRGLVSELFAIIGVFAGFYTAYTYYLKIAKPLLSWISNQAYLNILSFLIIFCVVFFAINFLGLLIRYILNIVFLGWVDRICGSVFGLIKGILIVSVFLVVLTSFLDKGAPVIKDSMLSKHVMLISENMARVVSEDMKKKFSEKIQALKKEWKIN
ncbi:membrane protein required for colicin V production [Desulfosarcina sp. BuS5]|uniref:CvpA family protein n=1 Tax=Desulfosarcina sp. BuS5 TaxID=933262 RepID=UPI00047F26E5|nr:CvpA family protein [Desulfosarcina sp. BuS5]WDN89244.1 membrane protein required for colicin V production [Desulfosarcina sp. BuS5]